MAGRAIIMIFACMFVGGTSVWILLSFLKKLKKIEDDFWGIQKKELLEEKSENAS